MGKSLKTIDGNSAAAWAAYAFTEVATIYPITPSSNMAEYTDEWASAGMKNMFGQTVRVSELQSEAGAAGAMHGVLSAGALSTTYTASQGLLLMIPNMYKIAGERLPGVFHVSARALAGHALSIFGDHSDVMSARQTGVAMLASGSVQETADIAPVAHLAAIEGTIPFMHFFDGFRTSHEIQKVEVVDIDTLGSLINQEKLQEFRDRSLNSEHPYTKGTAQNPDVFFQAREAVNPYYTALPEIVQKYMDEMAKITGRQYHLFDYYGANDATDVIIAMGSVTETIDETVDYLMNQGKKVGVLKVHLYRPFAIDYFLKALPETVERISVLDRVKELGANGEPLYLDVYEAFKNADKKPFINSGRYGLGSKDTTPSQILAVYKNLALGNDGKDRFTVGIEDDVTHLSLDMSEFIVTEPETTTRCKFWGLGSDGTVGANKQAIKIIGDNTELYAQAYFAYDSKKSGGITLSHLRFGKERIKSTYLVGQADFISCSQQSYVNRYDLLEGLKDGGTFLLNTVWSPEEVEAHLPNHMKKAIADRNIQFYTINATNIAKEIGLGNRTNMIMQAAFFKLTNIIAESEAVGYLKDGIKKAYGKKGEVIVEMNNKAVEEGIKALHQFNIPTSWANLTDEEVYNAENIPAFVKNIANPINAQKGDYLPVSMFSDVADGSLPNGTAAYEKRGIAVDLPVWDSENCIQCNFCSFVCPHAAIRPFLLDVAEMGNAPEGLETLNAMGKGLEGLQYRIQVSTLDCTGCNNCVDICPGKKGNKALHMVPSGEVMESEIPNWNYLIEEVSTKEQAVDHKTVKGSQFAQPLFEFSGACAGCGETPFVKLITQLFGDRMTIANATGCSSIYGGSYPATPFTTNSKDRGPAWANSLFEDNAEYGYGMQLAYLHNRLELKETVEKLLSLNVETNLQTALQAWYDGYKDSKASVELSAAVKQYLPSTSSDLETKLLLDVVYAKRDFLEKKSVWIIGGDGWAYDIGYGGLDHVVAAGEDVNILVLDTEIYSNTGGQASKSTPTSAIAKFAASGKRQKKKDLGLICMTYGTAYVAQVALADRNQTLKAMNEAESFDGPSVVIAYSPCISHGIKGGLTHTPTTSDEAVKSGYWHLYRYNPAAEGNKFTLDSKEPTGDFRAFLDQQVRFNSLKRSFPDQAEALYAELEQQAKEKFEVYKKLAETQIF